jgi:hypothetical protein
MTTYALVMIVKDATADLPRTLAAARPYISSWTICDTGSTDGTQAMVRDLLDGIPGTLYEDAWVNFGHNRSLALERARGTADWLMLMDADMAPTFAEGWEPDPALDAYMIEMGRHTATSYRLPLLVSGRLAWKSFGAEYTALADGSAYQREATDGLTIDMTALDRSSPEKFAWHAGMLEASLAEDPANARTVFYLAQSYRCLGRSEEARAMYLRRAGMPGYDEETYFAAYQAAMLATDWQTQAVELMAAWEMRSWRGEALCSLLRILNAHNLHQAAYALSGHVPTLHKVELMFVMRDVWDWGIKFERSIAAWWCGWHAEARMLCDELLANPRLPDDIRTQVEANRAFSEAA